MVLGIGTDLLNMKRMQGIQTFDDPFVRKNFTDREREQALERQNPFTYLATRFAGKEAVFKCLGVNGNDVLPHEIEILGNADGAPVVTLMGRAEEIARTKGICGVEISLSYDTDYVLAFAIAQGVANRK